MKRNREGNQKAESTTANVYSSSDPWLTENNIEILNLDKTTVQEIADNHSEIPESQKKSLKVVGWDQPKPIQAASWGVLKRNLDLVSIAETGSGKTGAFSFPLIDQLDKHTKNQVLVLCPTRELALQSYEVMVKIFGVLGMKVACVQGGEPRMKQAMDLKNSNIVIATPGRCVDLAEDARNPWFKLSNVRHLIIDEADRMLDMGFEPIVTKICKMCDQSQRQTCMFSATWPKEVQKIAQTFMKKNQAMVKQNQTGVLSNTPSANKRVTQNFMFTNECMTEDDKFNKLKQVVSEYCSTNAMNLSKFNEPMEKDEESKDKSVVIFTLRKQEAKELEFQLKDAGQKVCSLHGDKTQDQRTLAFNSFKRGQTPILVATDVASRGLDIPNVSAVINQSFPQTVEDQVHRIGRTGRNDLQGNSHTFMNLEVDMMHSQKLIKVLTQSGQKIPQELNDNKACKSSKDKNKQKWFEQSRQRRF